MGARLAPVVDATNSWSLSRFLEGPRTLNEKIIGVVLSAFASLASFFFLPRAAAGVLTGALVILCAAFCRADRLENAPAHANYPLPSVGPVLNLRVSLSDTPSGVRRRHVCVNGQVQPVLQSGARMIARGNMSPQRLQRMRDAPWRYGIDEHSVPQFQPTGENQPRAAVGHRTYQGQL